MVFLQTILVMDSAETLNFMKKKDAEDEKVYNKEKQRYDRKVERVNRHSNNANAAKGRVEEKEAESARLASLIDRHQKDLGQLQNRAGRPQ